MRRRVAALPAILTLGNAFCGFIAIAYVAKASRALGAVPEQFESCMEAAGWFVLLAMVFDALDGKVARLMRAESDFGVQLDSLADAVSFGVAPALMVLAVAQREETPLFRIALAASCLYVICALLRLARYNVMTPHETEGNNHFTGLPTPAAAGVIASLVTMTYYAADKDLKVVALKIQPAMDMLGQFLLPAIVVILALLMVSQVRYVHLLNKYLRDQEAFDFIVIIALVGLFFFFARPFSIPLAFLLYVCWGLGGHTVRLALARKRRRSTPERDAPEK